MLINDLIEIEILMKKGDWITVCELAKIPSKVKVLINSFSFVLSDQFFFALKIIFHRAIIVLGFEKSKLHHLEIKADFWNRIQCLR